MDPIREVAELTRAVLDPLGVYLHGSAVLDGLKPASDLDFLVVTRRPMERVRRRALLDGLLALPCPRPVELTVVVQSEIRPWRFPPTADFQYGEWLRAEFESGTVPVPEPMPDLALLVTMALAGNHPLSGPPPAEVLDPVPHADVVRASLAGVPGLLADLDHDTRNVVLTLARVWTTVATGAIRSKAAAADWALARLPPAHRAVLAHARELYLECRYDEESWPDDLRARVPEHVRHVVAEVDRLSG
ncbi:streptomycin 3'-adenylyltransferase [Saccharothrix saharensis]|uniref:Streptomycin 3'-adenylyltransferase n=1 Tax=Saccharothrix saharensis TaxID=571190 RepID=A0A543J9R5_9PSEU|nr:aminoglycoside adenylyltransferase domain-containing protein [Saccharothrix saharensis]TQM79563.1 streptomycin 3'-adenylyltransferase [Saccharothrix saharensis]